MDETPWELRDCEEFQVRQWGTALKCTTVSIILAGYLAIALLTL